MTDPNDPPQSMRTPPAADPPTQGMGRAAMMARAEAEAEAERVALGVEKSKARTAARVPRLFASRVMASQAAAKARK